MNWITPRRTPARTLLAFLLARTLPAILLALTLTFSPLAPAQVTTTQVADTIFRADGSAAGGTVVVSWPAFSTATGQAVPAGSVAVPIGAGGALSVQLAPNAGSNPMGSYYTAQYHLNDGSNSKEYWVVPVSGSPVKISAIKSAVMPLSVAQNSVSKAYVDQAIANAVSGGTTPTPQDGTGYVRTTGDTMTGPLVLPGDPTAATQAADKHYVDQSVGQVATGVGQKVSEVPTGTQTVIQPTGSQLQTNLLNGEIYASQYVNGLGNNGIANATASPDCTNGCEVKVDNSYKSTEPTLTNTWKDQTYVVDTRLGGRRDAFVNPGDIFGNGNSVAQSTTLVTTRNSALSPNGTVLGEFPNSIGLDLSLQALAGGNNLGPVQNEVVPFGKTNYHVQQLTGTFNTTGQHALNNEVINCYAVGDCLIGTQYIYSSGGIRDAADEGAHPFDLLFSEDPVVFTGTCTTGCTAGATTVSITPTNGVGTQGEGRFLLDMNLAKVLSTGTLVGGNSNGTPYATAAFSGTSFPISIFFTTAQAELSQANSLAPGLVTVPIKTSGVTSGFATNTAAAPATSGVACVVDQSPGGASIVHNYEMASYTVTDGTHFRLNLVKPHASNATIAIGGLCGYGLEQTVDTASGMRQVFPIVGSYSPTALYYASGTTPIVGIMNRTSAYLNVSSTVATVARSGGVVTLTVNGGFPQDINGLSMTVAGVADSSYNGVFPVTTISSSSLTYNQAGADSTSTGGTLSYLTGGYKMYPMAEVLGVMNPATRQIDGQLTLAANTVPWAANDAVEMPHYYQERIGLDSEQVNQVTPRASGFQSAGISYTGNNGPGLIGWYISNNAPPSGYLGAGGTHTLPSSALTLSGPWQETMGIQAGSNAAFHVSCNIHGCGRWNSFYNLFVLDSAAGADTILYQPSTSTMLYNMRGAGYTFSPQAFTATNIVTQTLTAGTINGSVSGNSITSGAIAAAYLPPLGGSGVAHAAGIAPDPGPNLGNTRFLREDGTWSLPPAGSATGSTGLLAGATADYNFMQGSGTILADATGNGNNGTFSAAAPTWVTNGLAFSPSQGVGLPAALNGTRTFFLAIYMNPITAGPQGYNDYPVMISSSGGASGFSFMNNYASPNGSFVPYSYAPTLFVNGNSVTRAANLISGFHVMAVTLGTAGSSVDHLYIDGVEVAVYSGQGASAGAMTSGNLFLGSAGVAPWQGSGINGTMYRMRTYPTQLTAGQVQQVSTAIASEVNARGVPVTPVPISLAAPQFQAVGDSITFGQGVATPWPSLLTLTNQPAYTMTNWGITGITLLSENGSEPNRAALRCTTTSGPSIAVVFSGTNDFQYNGSSPSQVFTMLGGEVQTLKHAGCLVYVGTMLSRVSGDYNGINTYDADKNNYDGLILSQWKAIGADGVIDFAADPRLGADGANAGTFFQPDHVHPTQAGQAILAAEASNVFNYAFGYNETNPHVVATPNYAMTAGDGYISLSGLTGASTMTLPDCTGQSGATYRINNPQSAFAVAVQPFGASQQINGLGTVPVPANATLSLRDTPNPKTTAGCHWEF